MDYLLPILPYLLLIIACYFMISRNRSRGEAAAFLLAIVAGIPLCDGGMLLFRESGRWQDGRVTSGVVIEK